MSDLSTIHFRSFLAHREEVAKDLEVSEFWKKLEHIATLFMALRKIILVRGCVDEMLKVLHESAVKNNDFEAIGKVEIICKQMKEKLDE